MISCFNNAWAGTSLVVQWLRFHTPNAGRQTQRSPEGPRHLHRIPRLSEAPREVPYHARGEGERVLALESREGTRASRRDRKSVV